jgi:hypothetical protein
MHQIEMGKFKNQDIKIIKNKNMIRLIDVREWIDTLPKEFLKFNVVNAEEGKLTKDGEYTYRMDKPVISLNVDEEKKEILILNDKPK